MELTDEEKSGLRQSYEALPMDARRRVDRTLMIMITQTEAHIRKIDFKYDALDLLEWAVDAAVQGVNMLRQGVSFACGAGCSSCCYLKIEAFSFEMAGIAQYVLNLWSIDEVFTLYRQLKEKSELAGEISHNEYLAKKIACVFLSEHGTCRIYPVRPIACVTYHSFDKQECISALENGGGSVRQSVEIMLGISGIPLGVMNVVNPDELDTLSKKDLDHHSKLLPLLQRGIQEKYGVSL